MEKYFDAAKNQVTKNIQNRMLQTISHEFGTYLSILFSILNISMLDHEVSEKVKQEYLIPFHQNTMLIHLLIQDFKDYQDILFNRFSIKLVKSDIKKLLRESIELVQKQADDKQIQLNVHIQDSIQSMIHIDPTRFKQILINLLQNSLKFSEQNKQINISMQHPQDDNENIQVIVEDQGIGMDEDEQLALQRLLQEGVSENRISNNSSGYGFGLTVSNKIALKLNEQIKYEKKNSPESKKLNIATQSQQGLYFDSIPKQGSRFWFFINVEKSEFISQKQQQYMFQSQVSSNPKKLMQQSIMMYNDQLIEFENKSPLLKTTSLNHEFRNTQQADSVFFDDMFKKVENRLTTQSAHPSPKLSMDNKTHSIKQSNKPSSGSITESSSNKISPNTIPVTLPTTNNQLSFLNSSTGNQSPQPPPIRVNNSTFSFNNASQMHLRHLTNENSNKTIENNFRSIDDDYQQEDDLESSDHIPPIPSSNIEEKAFEVLRGKKCSEIENISQEQKDQITSLSILNPHIGELCRQQKSEMILQSNAELPYILIVDDCQTNHNCLILYLERLYKFQRKQILQAYNGVQGIEKVKQFENKIRLIFMDLNMPILNGKEATSKIREFEKEKNLSSFTIVAYTAYSDPSTENECLNECGFDYFLAKPVADPSKLKDILLLEEIIS